MQGTKNYKMKKDVRIVIDKEGVLICAGDPNNSERDKEILQWIREGCTVKTISYSDFQKLKLYEKV